MLEKTGLETLENRRIEACDRFAKKCLDGKFAHWFPRRECTRQLRGGDAFLEQYARADRLMNTPVFYMRRRLNYLAKEGML